MKHMIKSPIIRIFIFLCIFGLFLSGTLHSAVAVNENVPVKVLYLVRSDQFDSTYTDSVASALELDSVRIQIKLENDSTTVDLENQTTYDVIVLQDYALTVPEIQALSTWLEFEGHGLIVLMGPTLTSGTSLFDELGILPGITTFQPNEIYKKDDELIRVQAISDVNSSFNPPLIQGIAWNSAPELVNYTRIPNVDQVAGNHEYIYMKNTDGTTTVNSLIFGRSLVSTQSYDNVIVFVGWFTPKLNVEFQLWPYFNYVMFNTVQSVSNQPVIVAYKNWEYSPVPHLLGNILLGGLVVVCLTIGLGLFIRERKKGKSKRKIHEAIETIETTILEKKITVRQYLEQKSELTEMEQQILQNFKLSESSRELVQVSSKEDLVSKTDNWETIGFHRQIGGFLQTIFSLIFLVIPQLIISSFIFPSFIQPHPQAGGYYSFTLHLFEAIWLLFDMGTSYSFMKFFAENRIERPEKAFHYAQIFVWWQILSGTAQIFLVAFMGSFYFKYTNLSYLTWIFIIHSLIQFPGFFRVFEFFFEGMQRTDKSMITVVLQSFLLRLVCQLVMVPLFRIIYRNQVVYGDVFGAGIGMIVGLYLGDILMFFISLKWYKNMKLSLHHIFAVEFTRKEFKQSLKFGSKMAIGEVWVPAVWMLQVLLIAQYVPSYAAEQGYFELAWTIIQLPGAAALIYRGTVGGLTEAWTYKKNKLLNYITGASMRLGMFWTMFMCAALWAIGESFILGTAGQGWGRAAQLLPALVLFQLLGPFSWQGDMEFTASGHPGYAGIAWIIEQTLRALFMVIFLPRKPIMEVVIWSYIISLTIKDIFVWIIIETKIHQHKWYIWPTFIAPALAGAVTYGLLKLATYLLPPGLITVLIIFILTFFVVIYIFAFFTGFFGGFDTNTLNEYKKSAWMVRGVGFLAKGVYWSIFGGAKISPFHNRFPIKIYEEAYLEADELTAIKKKIT